MADRVTPEPSTPDLVECTECGAAVFRLAEWKHTERHRSVDDAIDRAQAGEW